MLDNARYKKATPLRETLEATGLTQAALARFLETDRMQVVRWIAGEHTPQESRREQIVEVLNAAKGSVDPLVTVEQLWPDAYQQEAA